MWEGRTPATVLTACFHIAVTCSGFRLNITQVANRVFHAPRVISLRVLELKKAVLNFAKSVLPFAAHLTMRVMDYSATSQSETCIRGRGSMTSLILDNLEATKSIKNIKLGLDFEKVLKKEKDVVFVPGSKRKYHEMMKPSIKRANKVNLQALKCRKQTATSYSIPSHQVSQKKVHQSFEELSNRVEAQINNWSDLSVLDKDIDEYIVSDPEEIAQRLIFQKVQWEK